MRRTFVPAVGAAALTGLAAGFLLYGVAFVWLFREGALTIPGVMRERPLVGWIVAGQVPFSVLVTLVVRWRGDLTPMGGAKSGAVLGLCMGAGYDFAQYGTSHLWTLTATLVDPFLSAVLVAASGAAAAAVLSRGRAAD